MGISDVVFYAEDIENLLSMSDEKNLFTPPDDIISRIKTFVNTNAKGVLFLQMERGMGKTTLVRAMDQLAMDKVSLDGGRKNITVRAYYINSMFSYRINHFQNETLSVLTSYKVDKEIKRLMLSNINTSFIGSENISGGFAGFLGDMRKTYDEKFSSGKLLYIIDGLDEMCVETNEQRSIFDCIPSPDQLSDGVYILLTGRPANETTGWIRDKYTELERVIGMNSTIIYRHGDETNTAALRKYLETHLPENKHDMIQGILEKSGFRFLHVQALRELTQAGAFDDGTINGNIIQCYMDVLKSKYGEGKFYNSINRLLLIVSLANEPATITELAYLYNPAKEADLQFIGFLADLRGLLRIDRTNTKEGISADIGTMHEDWKQYLIERSGSESKEIVASWTRNLISRALDDNAVDTLNLGESYIAANLYELLRRNCPSQLQSVANRPVLQYLFRLSVNLYDDKTITALKRAEKICASIIYIADETNMTDELAAELATVYMRRGLIRADLQLWNDAIDDFSRSIKILEDLRDNHEQYNAVTLAEVYTNRGNTYSRFLLYNEALDDSKRSIEILEELRESGEAYDKGILLTAHMNRSDIYNGLMQYDRAIEECNRIIEIHKNGELSDRNILAGAYVNLGIAYSKLLQHTEALDDFNRGIKILEELHKNGELRDEQSLPIAYINCGNICRELGRGGEAIADYTLCIEALKVLRKNGKLSNAELLADAYINRCVTNCSVKMLGDAIYDCTRYIGIMEESQDGYKQFDDCSIALAYSYRGYIYDTVAEYEAAFEDYSKCIEILETICGNNGSFDECALVRVYMERGNTNMSLNNYQAALQDYNRSINTGEALLKKGLLRDKNILANAYTRRGVAYTENGRIKDARTDIARSVEIKTT